MKWSILAAVLLLLSPIKGQAEVEKKAWLEVTEEGRMVTIEVYSNLEEGVGGKYNLQVIKAGPSGRSANRQGGMVAGSATTADRKLSASTVSVEAGAQLEVLLTVEDDQGQIYEDKFSKAY